MSIGSLIIDLIANTGGFETDLRRAAKAAEKRSKEIDRSVSQLGRRITGALTGIVAAFSFSKIVQATSQAEKALAALAVAVENNASAAGASTPELADFSAALQRLTTFSDDSIQGMQALLLSFKQIGGDEFKRAQVAILDLATALGKDLNSSALLVGRALADPVKGMTALSRAGVVLSTEQQDLVKSLADSGRSAEAQGVLLRELEARFGGAAKAARDTFGGALAGLKNAFDDLLEVKSGLPGSIDAIKQLTALLEDPATGVAVDTLTSSIITGFGAAAKVIAETAGGVKVLAENLAAARYGAASDDLVRLNEQLDLALRIRDGSESRLRFFGKDGIVEWYSDAELDAEIRRLRQQIAEAMQGTARPLAAAAAATLAPGGAAKPGDPVRAIAISATRIEPDAMQKLYADLDRATRTQSENAISAYNAQREALEVLYSAGTIGLDTYNARLSEALDTLLPEVETTAKRITEVASKIGDSFGEQFKDVAFTSLTDGLETALNEGAKKGWDGFLDAGLQTINRLVAAALAKRLAEGLFSDTGGQFEWVKSLGSLFSAKSVPGRAYGGDVSAGTMYRINEREPEFFKPNVSGKVVPLSKMSGAGGGVTVHQNIAVQGRVDRRTSMQLAIDSARRTRIATARLG